MEQYKIGEVEMRFAEIVWRREPVSLEELAEAARAELGWKKSETERMVTQLCGKGIFALEKDLVKAKVSQSTFQRIEHNAAPADRIGEKVRGRSSEGFRHSFWAPVAFEEGDVKSRIKNIMKYQKTFAVLAVCAVAVCILGGALFFTKAEPVREDSEKGDRGAVLDSEFLRKEMVGKKWILGSIAEMALPSWTEVLLYETTADITHDGVEDLLRVVTYVDEENASEAFVSVENALEYGVGGVEVKLYRGLEEGFFEKEASYISENVHESHAGNGTICLSRKDGQDYLLFSNPYEMQGTADYFFRAYYVDDKEGVVIDNYGEVSFMTGVEPGRNYEERYQHRRAEKVPEFKERISPYIEDAEILISFDTSTEPFYSTKERKCPASEYFNTVWERKDDVY